VWALACGIAHGQQQNNLFFNLIKAGSFKKKELYSYNKFDIPRVNDVDCRHRLSLFQTLIFGLAIRFIKIVKFYCNT
jgi:hypothetical protein